MISETTSWVAGKLEKARNVTNVEIVSEQVLRVSRINYAPYMAGILATKCVDADAVTPLVNSKFGVEIIANIPKESYWTGGALDLARASRIATGGYGDLLRVIDVSDVRAFESKETRFVERSLNQHSRVVKFERLHDRLYRIERTGLDSLTVSFLNEYELTADHVRTARDRYGQFSIAVITNPNGKATTSAEEVAQFMGVEILKWGPFLGRLNKK